MGGGGSGSGVHHMLCRTSNSLLPEMKVYANAPNRHIVLYAIDERAAMQVPLPRTIALGPSTRDRAAIISPDAPAAFLRRFALVECSRSPQPLPLRSALTS